MISLLGHDVPNRDALGRCAFERCYAEQRTSGCGGRTRLFVGGPFGRSESGLPANGISGKGRVASVLRGVSHINPAACSVTASGPKPTPGGTALFCFHGFHRNLIRKNTEKICDKPTVNAELGTWESGPLAWLRRV